MPVTILLLHGDGVIFADPIRAVVVDKDGQLMAASPMSASLDIICSGAKGGRTCWVCDGLAAEIYVPLGSEMRPAGSIVDGDGPYALKYPELIDAEFGFSRRSATFTEKIQFEVQGMIDAWPATILALVWWFAISSIWVPVFWRLHVNGWRVNHIAARGIFVLLLRTAGTLTLLLFTAFVWLQAPYSPIYLLIVASLGFVSAFALFRHSRVVAEG